MVKELEDFFGREKVFFGIKECLKKSGDVERAVVSSDCREEIKKLLVANKIDFEESDLSKEDISGRLNTNFKCEVFGLRK